MNIDFDSIVKKDNREYGITIGHRDTDNLIKDCVIERNGKVGILCGRSDATYEFFAPHRCTVQGCTLRDNGTTTYCDLIRTLAVLR